MKVKSLAALKRAIQGGTRLKLAEAPPNHRYLGTIRAVAKVQTNAIMFGGGSWLYWGRASSYTFTENGFVVSGEGLPKLRYEFVEENNIETTDPVPGVRPGCRTGS